MKAYIKGTGQAVFIWKIPTLQEMKLYPALMDPPLWICIAEKKGFVKCSNQPHKWFSVNITTESGFIVAYPGDWIVKFDENDYGKRSNKVIEEDFRIIWPEPPV